MTTDMTGLLCFPPVLASCVTPRLSYYLKNKCSSCVPNVQNKNLFHLHGKVYIVL